MPHTLDHSPSARTPVEHRSHARKDAHHRALRTALQALAFDLVVAVVLALQTHLGDPSSDWSAIDGQALALLVAKTVVVTLLAFVMRRLSALPGTLTAHAPSRSEG